MTSWQEIQTRRSSLFDLDPASMLPINALALGLEAVGHLEGLYFSNKASLDPFDSPAANAACSNLIMLAQGMSGGLWIKTLPTLTWRQNPMDGCKILDQAIAELQRHTGAARDIGFCTPLGETVALLYAVQPFLKAAGNAKGAA